MNPSKVCGWLGRLAMGCLVAVALAGCGGGEDEPLPEYRIGGTATGLSGTVVLQNNGTDDLSVGSNGGFTFAEPVRRGNTYEVTIRTQPQDQVCTVANASGVAAGDVANVIVDCIDVGIPTYTIGGTVSGLTGEVILRNGAEFITVRANGTWTFATRVRSGTPYNVTIATQPEGQTCTIENGAGTVGTANVTNIVVTCVTPPPATYAIGGNVSGLSGTLVLRNGTENLTVSSNGPFAFPTRLTSGSSYSVTVASQPAGQTCDVTRGSGTVGQADVTNIDVSCRTTNADTYTVGGTVTGLTGTIVLGLGSEQLTLVSNGTFSFATRLANGTEYTVSVVTQPSGQTCTITNGTGRITGNSSVTNVFVACADVPPPPPAQFSIGGTVSGVTSGTLRLGLQHPGGAGTTIDLTGDGPFSFDPDRVTAGASYSVSIVSSPEGHECSLSNAAGIALANVTNVGISCEFEDEQFSVGGAVTGLTGSGLRIENSGSNATVVDPGAATFTLPTEFDDGSIYDVGVAVQPQGQTCVITQSQGTVAGADVANVAVICVDNDTDALRGTYAVTSSLGETLAYLTFFPDGVYVYGSVENDPGCGTLNGNGAEYGVYNYDDSTGAFAIRNTVVDTNGSCGVWNGGPRFAGVLTSSSSGGSDRTYLLALTAGGIVELTPIESKRDEIWGSFADAYRKIVWVFVQAGDDEALRYFDTQTQADPSRGYAAGVEYGCAAVVGSEKEGALAPNLTATCLAPAPGASGPVDTNGTAGLSHHPGNWSFRVDRDELLAPPFHGFRVERD